MGMTCGHSAGDVRTDCEQNADGLRTECEWDANEREIDGPLKKKFFLCPRSVVVEEEN